MSEKYDRIIADLSNWSSGSPCGAVAYIGNDAAASEYCDDVDDFGSFFTDHRDHISLATVLMFNIDEADIKELKNILKRIAACFEKARSQEDGGN